MNLYETIGKSNPTYLLADPEGADAIGIPCEPGNGTVARGTVMTRKETGMYAPAESADVTETATLCVLDETVDTDADAKLAAEARLSRGAPDCRPRNAQGGRGAHSGAQADSAQAGSCV